jgi:hypothetical protein
MRDELLNESPQSARANEPIVDRPMSAIFWRRVAVTKRILDHKLLDGWKREQRNRIIGHGAETANMVGVRNPARFQ